MTLTLNAVQPKEKIESIGSKGNKEINRSFLVVSRHIVYKFCREHELVTWKVDVDNNLVMNPPIATNLNGQAN